MNSTYVHGYDAKENQRLLDQANTLVELLHWDTRYPPGSLVLEVGCGVGAQTVTLAHNSPHALFTSIDISEDSIREARRALEAAGLSNVQFRQGDVFRYDLEPESFEHVFVCHVLELLAGPVDALTILKDLLRPGGTITVSEGDHGSAYFYPDSEAARQAIQCQVELQRRAGGNAMIGRELYPLLCEGGYHSVRVSPRMVYVDSSRPDLVDGFTKKTFTTMIDGVRESALKTGIIEERLFDKGIEDRYSTAAHDGVFCYTIFKAFGKKR